MAETKRRIKMMEFVYKDSRVIGQLILWTKVNMTDPTKSGKRMTDVHVWVFILSVYRFSHVHLTSIILMEGRRFYIDDLF